MTQTQRLDVRELINRNPLSRFQKLIIFLGFCVIALDGFDIAIMGFIAPTLKLEWGVSNHQLGLVISAALIGLALGAIFSGPLADWLGRKKIIINSVFFFGFWTIATAFSHNVEQMMFFRFMTGLGLGARDAEYRDAGRRNTPRNASVHLLSPSSFAASPSARRREDFRHRG